MALTDSDFPHPVPEGTAHDRALVFSIPRASSAPAGLTRLLMLHAQARRDLHTARFLERSPHAALLLMAAGTIVLAADWGSLKADFAWSLLLVTGIVGMVRNFIRGFARSLRRVPLQDAAADLRALLLFCGIAWGSGVFLVLPPAPPVLLAAGFALLPSLALTLLLGEGATGFTVAAAVMTAGAAQAQFWPHAMTTSLTVLALGTGLSASVVLAARQAACR